MLSPVALGMHGTTGRHSRIVRRVVAEAARSRIFSCPSTASRVIGGFRARYRCGFAMACVLHANREAGFTSSSMLRKALKV